MAILVTNTTTASPSVATHAADIRDIKPPVEIASAWAWLGWTLAALVLAAVLFALWKWWRKRQAQVLIVPPVPAHVRAKLKLQEALALLEQPKPFCIAVSDTARCYLEERFKFHAPERTTEEFLYELQRTDLLTRDQKASLGEFLQGCDLVKFAKYEPREPELRDLHGSAVRLVEETEPAEVRSPESRVQSPPPAPSTVGLDHASRDTQHESLDTNSQSPIADSQVESDKRPSEIVNRKS